MPKLFIPPPLRDLTGGREQAAVPGATVAEAIDQLDGQFPGVRGRLCEAGRLKPGIAVSVDGIVVSEGLRAALRPESEVHFLPAIGGG